MLCRARPRNMLATNLEEQLAFECTFSADCRVRKSSTHSRTRCYTVYAKTGCERDLISLPTILRGANAIRNCGRTNTLVGLVPDNTFQVLCARCV
jgi:hypothetical protein